MEYGATRCRLAYLSYAVTPAAYGRAVLVVTPARIRPMVWSVGVSAAGLLATWGQETPGDVASGSSRPAAGTNGQQERCQHHVCVLKTQPCHAWQPLATQS